jgi:hypothetical protein
MGTMTLNDYGNQLAAVKLMLRCRLVDDGFRPLLADLQDASETALVCDNEKPAASLSGWRR